MNYDSINFACLYKCLMSSYVALKCHIIISYFWECFFYVIAIKVKSFLNECDNRFQEMIRVVISQSCRVIV